MKASLTLLERVCGLVMVERLQQVKMLGKRLKHRYLITALPRR